VAKPSPDADATPKLDIRPLIARPLAAAGGGVRNFFGEPASPSAENGLGSPQIPPLQ
jgi:hypothetical protein